MTIGAGAGLTPITIANAANLQVTTAGTDVVNFNFAGSLAMSGSYNVIDYTTGTLSSSILGDFGYTLPGYAGKFVNDPTHDAIDFVVTGTASIGYAWKGASQRRRFVDHGFKLDELADSGSRPGGDLLRPLGHQDDGRSGAGGDVTVAGLTFNSLLNHINITANTPNTDLVLDNTANSAASPITVSGNHTISAPLTLTSSATVTTATAADSLTLAGAISGQGGLTTTGSGVVIVSNANNTYTGGTSILGGTLREGVSEALPARTVPASWSPAAGPST